MSLIHFPNDLVAKEQVLCAICTADIPFSKATVGQIDADGLQAFACNAHFWEGNRFILGWVDFAAKGRLRAFSLGVEPNVGGGYARTIP